MNESSNKSPNKSKDSNSTKAQAESEKGPNDKDAKLSPSKPINVHSILKIVTDAPKIDEGVVERVFERIDESRDSALLIYHLLKNFLTETNPGEWHRLTKHDVPRRLLTKLCLTVEIDDLSNAWDQEEEEGLAEIQKLIKASAPTDYETAQSFLRDRKMLPLALIIFRQFRNAPAEMEAILSEWLVGIAQVCRKRRFNPCDEAQRAAKWLIDLASKKSKPSAFLDACSAVTLPLRALQKSQQEIAQDTKTREKLTQELSEKNTALEKSLREIQTLETQLETTNHQLAQASQKLKKLEVQLAFGGAQAGVSEEHAIGELKQRLKQSITAKTEDIKLFLDREKPNIQASLDLLSQIERQLD